MPVFAMFKQIAIAFLLIIDMHPGLWCAIHVQGPATIPDIERRALVALYQDTNGSNWNTKSNWLGAAGSEDTWYGIHITSGNVTSIDLADNNLVGSIPPELSDLTELKELRLGGIA